MRDVSILLYTKISGTDFGKPDEHVNSRRLKFLPDKIIILALQVAVSFSLLFR